VTEWRPDGVNPSELLDGSVGSLVPLWRWVLTHLTKGTIPVRRTQPWCEGAVAVLGAVHLEEEPVLSLESLLLSMRGVLSRGRRDGPGSHRPVGGRAPQGQEVRVQQPPGPGR
jgi:hypothetical protein